MVGKWYQNNLRKSEWLHLILTIKLLLVTNGFRRLTFSKRADGDRHPYVMEADVERWALGQREKKCSLTLNLWHFLRTLSLSSFFNFLPLALDELAQGRHARRRFATDWPPPLATNRIYSNKRHWQLLPTVTTPRPSSPVCACVFYNVIFLRLPWMT